jgi:hypothetical protein
MLHNEFEKLTGLQVTEEEFNAINAMYETADDSINKQLFCADWMKHKDSVLLCDYYKQVGRLEKTVQELKEEIEEHEDLLARACANHHKMLEEVKRSTAEFLIDQAEKLESRELAHKAVELIGMKEFIGIKLQKGYKLYQKDKDFIIEQMGVKKIVESINEERDAEFDED